jgi:hypothetical protein
VGIIIFFYYVIIINTMSSIFDNKLLVLALFFLAFFLISQILSPDVSKEGMTEEAVIVPPQIINNTTVSNSNTSLSAPIVPIVPIAAASSGEGNAEYASAMPNSLQMPTMPSSAVPVEMHSSFNTESPFNPNPNANELVSSSMISPQQMSSQELQQNLVEDNYLQPEQEGYYNQPYDSASTSTPPNGLYQPNNFMSPEAYQQMTGESMQSLSVMGTDTDSMFNHQGTLNGNDLIPPPDKPELYGDLVPDARLNQNFLQNRFSLGIDVSAPKRNFSNDLRGSPQNPIPLTQISPFGMPSILPDIYRRSLSDVC